MSWNHWAIKSHSNWYLLDKKKEKTFTFLKSWTNYILLVMVWGGIKTRAPQRPPSEAGHRVAEYVEQGLQFPTHGLVGAEVHTTNAKAWPFSKSHAIKTTRENSALPPHWEVCEVRLHQWNNDKIQFSKEGVRTRKVAWRLLRPIRFAGWFTATEWRFIQALSWTHRVIV